MKNRIRKTGVVMIAALALIITSLGFIRYNDEKNVKISDFSQKINLADYNTLTDNSSSNKIIVSAKNKKDIKKLEGVKNIIKSNDLYFVTFDSVKNSDNAYEKLKNKKISVNKDLKVSVQDNEESSDTVSKITNNEKGTRVAVIDTGVNGAEESYDVTGEGTSDLSGHGTEMAKIIEETSDNGANIISIKAFDKNGDGSIASLYAAIELARELDVKVINLSATTGYKIKADYVVDAIKEATKSGIKVICAAGNYSADVKDFATANIKEADVVTAVEENGDFAAYSNFGETVDYSALGTYGNDSGTSISTARVTGYFVKYGKDLDKQGKDLGEEGWDEYFGNATFGVDVEEGKLPEDGFESVLFHGNWKELSDEEFKNAIKEARETMLSVWLNSLSDEELKLALSRDSMLNWEHYELDKNGNKTNVTTHAEWLMSWNIPDVKTMAVLDYNNGHIPVTINDNNTGSSQTLYSGTVYASVSGSLTANVQRRVSWSVTTYSNSCGFSLKTSSNKTTQSGGGNWSIFNFSFSYAKPENRYAVATCRRAYSETSTVFSSNVNNSGMTTATTHAETVTVTLNANHLGMNVPSGSSRNYGSYIVTLNRAVMHLTFDSNGGDEPNRTSNYYYMNSPNIGMSAVSRKGRKFLGWSKNKNATSADFNVNNSYYAWDMQSFSAGTTTTDFYATIYAVWGDYTWTTLNFYQDSSTLLEKSYITYDNVIVKSKYTVSNPTKNPSDFNEKTFTKEGARFAGWNTKIDGTGDTVITKDMLSTGKINSGSTSNSYWSGGKWIYSANGDKTLDLYPKWEYKTADITYDDNFTGSAARKQMTVSSAKLIDVSGYSECTFTLASSQTYMIYGYDSEMNIVYRGDKYESDFVTDKAGRIDISNCHYIEFMKQTSHMPDYDVSLTLFNLKKYTNTVSSGDVNNIRVNPFIRDGYVFTGWNTEKDGSGKSYSEGQSLGHYPNVESTENEDLTLYAQWVKADYYKTMQFMNTKEDKVIPPTYGMLTLDDTFTQTVNIKKKDSDNIVVPGTVFNIECSDGSTTTVTTDDDGKAMATFDFSVSLADTGTEYYWYCTNYDELDDMGKKQVKDLGRYINEAEARTAAQTDLKNYIKTIKKDFTVSEVSHPDYVGSVDDITFSLTGDGAVKDLEVIDPIEVEEHVLQNECTLTPVFKIRKTNAMNEVLPGVKINIYSDANKKNLLVSGTTDENGEIYYEGAPVTYKTSEYKYVDVDAYGTASDRLKQYCKDHNLYTSYEEAMAAYKADANYKIVNGHDDDNENPLASREKEMERTYYYKEVSTISGYVLDGELRSATVFWFKSDDINNNLITNANKSDVSESNSNVNADGEPVDFATKFVNYQENVLKQVTDGESFTQNLTLIKKGTLGNILPNATFDVTVDGVKKQYVTDANGKITISNTFTTNTEDEYYYIENLDYVSDSEVKNILATATDTKHIFKTEAEAKEAARAEVESKRDRAYHIHEVSAPTGYKACADTDITINYNDSKEITLIDENTASIRLIKNDSKKAPVENAKFGAFTTDTSYKNNESYSYKGDTYYLLKDVNTDKNGEAIIDGLNPDGKTKYIIIERVTKAGKVLLADPIEVGTLPVILDTKPDGGYKGTVVESNGKYHYFDITYTVTNDSIFELPSTGATTPYWYLTGLVIMLAGALIMFRKKGEEHAKK